VSWLTICHAVGSAHSVLGQLGGNLGIIPDFCLEWIPDLAYLEPSGSAVCVRDANQKNCLCSLVCDNLTARRLIGNAVRFYLLEVVTVASMTPERVLKLVDHGVSLYRENLDGIDLNGCNLRGADFGFANLRGANLENTNLICANLEGADLENAMLKGADLRYANLTGANVKGTILENVDLFRATKLKYSSSEDGE
jgi:uncharacterized protein YjbI with pentapeptide repeats